MQEELSITGAKGSGNTPNIPQGMRIKDVPRILKGPGQGFDIESIGLFIELPLIGAVEICMKKNIRTYWTTAHAGDDIALLYINPAHLTEANREVARSHFGYAGDTDERVEIALPIGPDTLVSEVDECFRNLVGLFADQQQTSTET